MTLALPFHTCARCHAPIAPGAGNRPRIYCSPRCAHAAHRATLGIAVRPDDYEPLTKRAKCSYCHARYLRSQAETVVLRGRPRVMCPGCAKRIASHTSSAPCPICYDLPHRRKAAGCPACGEPFAEDVIEVRLGDRGPGAIAQAMDCGERDEDECGSVKHPEVAA